MKKLLMTLGVIGMLALPQIAKAENPTLLFNFGKLNVFVPLSEVNVVYQYDMVGKRSLVGGETPLIGIWKLQFTGGAVTSIDGAGSPFLGINLALPNPVPANAWTNEVADFVSKVNPGLFGGRDFKENAWILGIKASVSIFG